MKRTIIIIYIVIAIIFLAGCNEKVELSNISDLSARPDGKDIVVSWEPSSDANCYYIYRAEGNSEKYHYWGVTEKTTIRDVTIFEDRWYSYRVYPAVSTDDGYIRGDKYLSSDNVLALAKPKILTVEKTDTKCTIKWAEISNATSYSVYRKEEGEAEYSLLCDTAENYCVDNQISNNKVYSYKIQMNINLNGQTYSSIPSEAATAFKQPKITSVYREDLFTSVIAWDIVSDSFEYSVFRATEPQGEYELIGKTNNTYFRDASAYLLTSTTEETQVLNEYYYMIKINSNDQENISYYSESQSMKIESPQSTSKLFIARYQDFVSKKNGPKILQDDTIYDTEFENDLKYLKEEGYVTITSKEILDYLNSKAPLPDKAVMITIDDAKSGVYKYAYPLLKEYNMSAVLGVVGEYADGAETDNKYCSWEEITKMHSSGCFELASSSYYLNDTEETSDDKRSGVTKLSYEANDQYAKILAEDISLINNKLRSITGKNPAVFVYPYGERDNASDEILINELGYMLLLGDDDARRTRMNHFIDSSPVERQLRLLNRRDRLTGKELSEYIIAAQKYDEPSILSILP